MMCYQEAILVYSLLITAVNYITSPILSKSLYSFTELDAAFDSSGYFNEFIAVHKVQIGNFSKLLVG